MRLVHPTLTLALALSGTALASAANVWPPVHRTPERLPNAVLSRTTSAESATYTLKDIGGAPTNTFRAFYQPLGFNKTGQIVGQAYLASNPGFNYVQCVAWSGTAWINLSSSPSLPCSPSSGVSDANSSGNFGAVGQVYVPTNNQSVPFYVHASPKSATMTAFSSSSPADLYAMNASGVAVGYMYDTPVVGFAFWEPPAISSGTSIALLQSTCVTAVAGCMEQTYAYSLPFGQSRSITAGGTVLAYATDSTPGQFVEYTTGKKPTFVQFSLPIDNGNGAGDVRGMDDKGDVVYQEYDSKSQKYLGWKYSPSSNTARSFGVLTNSSCNTYTPLYVNGLGRVLGYTWGCSLAADQTYWTWDSTNGIVAVTFNHTPYNAATPELINDLGQIAVDLTTTANVHHWGILSPPTKL